MVSYFLQPVDLSPGDLLYYGGVEWLNISDFLGKIKKGLELHAMCFVFKTAVVFLCKERLRQKKKSLIVSAQCQRLVVGWNLVVPSSFQDRIMPCTKSDFLVHMAIFFTKFLPEPIFI